jgi:predicted DNA-binding transcriptional regulator YafY
MEAMTFLLGVTLRIILPFGLLFWISAELRAWDQKRGELC